MYGDGKVWETTDKGVIFGRRIFVISLINCIMSWRNNR